MTTTTQAIPLAGAGQRARARDTPRADVFTGPRRHLPRLSRSVSANSGASWLFLSAHAGAGAGLLTRLSWQAPQRWDDARRRGEPATDPRPPFAVNTDQAWPDPRLETTNAVVVVAATTMHGLTWAQDVAAAWVSGQAPPGLRLLGLVTVADQPGRPPRPIAAARRLLAGAYEQMWHVPYEPAYRLLTGLEPSNELPMAPAVDDVLTAICTTVTQGETR